MLTIEEKDIIYWAIGEGYQYIRKDIMNRQFRLKREYYENYHQFIFEELSKYNGDFTSFHKTLCENIADMFLKTYSIPSLGIIQLWINNTIKILTISNHCEKVRKYFKWNDDEIHVPLSDDLFKMLKQSIGFTAPYSFRKPYETLNNYDDYLYIQNYLKKQNITGVSSVRINFVTNNKKTQVIESEKGLIKNVTTDASIIIFDDDTKKIGGVVKTGDKEYNSYVNYPACSNNKNIEIVKCNKDLKEIGAEAFKNCYGLKEITLPPNIIKIEKDAFKGCVSLTSIIIPDSVKEIEEGAFNDCINLSKVEFKSYPYIAAQSCNPNKNFKNCHPDLHVIFGNQSYLLENYQKVFTNFFRN